MTKDINIIKKYGEQKDISNIEIGNFKYAKETKIKSIL